MTRQGAKVSVVGIALAIVALSLAPAARGTDRSFTLYMSTSAGWGQTPTTLSNPGPSLTVTQGDNVTLTLNSTDGHNHDWFIDYNNDMTQNGNEPNSPNFKNAQIVWNFTADRNGTFTYRSKWDPSVAGTIVMNAPGTPPSPPGGNGVVAGVAIALVAVIAVALIVLYLVERRGFLVRPPPPPAERPPRKA